MLQRGCTYQLAAALPTITKNLSIVGSGDTITAFSGGPYTILQVKAHRSVAISQARFTDGNDGMSGPGAIYNRGATVSLTGDTFAGNDGGQGGAIQNALAARLTISSSAFAGNRGLSIVPGGGAIANGSLATTTVSGTTFLDNQTVGSGGAIVNLGGTVTVNGARSTFTGNTAGRGGGAISTFLGTLNVAGATFSGNTAGTTGGAITNTGLAAAITPNAITASGFTGNRAWTRTAARSTRRRRSASPPTRSRVTGRARSAAAWPWAGPAVPWSSPPRTSSATGPLSAAAGSAWRPAPSPSAATAW